MITKTGMAVALHTTRYGSVSLTFGFENGSHEFDAQQAIQLAQEIIACAEQALRVQSQAVTPEFPAFARGGAPAPERVGLDQPARSKTRQSTILPVPAWYGKKTAPIVVERDRQAFGGFVG